MKNTVVITIVSVLLICSCINQQEEQKEWTAEEWKNHLFLTNPSLDQSINNMAAGLGNVEELPIGTHLRYKITALGTFEGMEMPYDMTMTIDIPGKESLSGKECTVVELFIEAEMEMEGESFDMVIAGKEWIDAAGTPLKIETEFGMSLFGELEMPMKLTMEFAGEEQYKGHECWVFTGVQSMDLMGTKMEMTITQYMDKETYVVVGMIIDGEEQEADSSFTEAQTYFQGLEWELGGRETITTELGTYDCQVIYLKDAGETVGTIWANEEFKSPLKYAITYEVSNMLMDMTMTLVEYSWSG